MSLSTIVSAFLCTTILVAAGDWPKFQGPNGNGVANESGLMKKWPSGGLKVLWTAKVGPGYGGVVGNSKNVYLFDRIPRQKDVMRCFSMKTGKEIWKSEYSAPGRISHPGSRSHPTLDGDRVYSIGPFGHVQCYDASSGKVVWKKNIFSDFGGSKPTWASTQAPSVYGDLLIVEPVGTKAGVAAYNKKTGAIKWQSKPLPGKMGYASPVITTIGGVDQILALTTTTTAGVDPKSGKILWQISDWGCKNPIISPFHAGDGKVFVTGGYGAGSAMFQVTKKGSKFSVKTLFKTMKCKAQIQQPILYKDHLYLNGNDKSKKFGMICMDLKGKVKWQTGHNPGFDWGGLLMADGMLYSIDGTKGDLCLIKPDPSGYKEVSRTNILSGKEIWGTIAMIDGKILCRDQKQLRCVDVRGK